MDGELFLEVGKGKEGMAVVKPFLLFPMTSLYLTVMASGIGTYELMDVAKFNNGFQIALSNRVCCWRNGW